MPKHVKLPMGPKHEHRRTQVARIVKGISFRNVVDATAGSSPCKFSAPLIAVEEVYTNCAQVLVPFQWSLIVEQAGTVCTCTSSHLRESGCAKPHFSLKCTSDTSHMCSLSLEEARNVSQWR